MKNFDLDTQLITKSTANNNPWTLKNAKEGDEIIGSISSGKIFRGQLLFGTKFLNTGFKGSIPEELAENNTDSNVAKQPSNK